MLNEAVLLEKQEIEVKPRRVDVLLDDESKFPLVLQLPPAEELESIKKLSLDKVSVQEIVDDSGASWEAAFGLQLTRNLEKHDEYKDSSVFLNHLASLSELAGKFDVAEEFIKSTIALDDRTVFKHRLGTNLIFQNRPDVAKELFSKLDLNTDSYANLRLAYLAIRNKNFAEAEKFVKKGIEIDPLDARVRLVAGALSLARGNFVEAINHLKIAIEERPNSTAACTNLGVAYLCMGSREQALKWIRRAVAISPINANAVALFSDLLIAERRHDEAIHILTSYLEYEQKGPAFWARLVRVYYDSGNFKKALETLKHQASLADTSHVWNNMALVYWKMGEDEKATQYFGLALKKQDEEKNTEWFVIRNMLTFLTQKRKYSEVSSLTKTILTPKTTLEISKDPEGFRIIVDHIISLLETERGDEGGALAETLLGRDDIHPELRANLLIFVTSYFSNVDLSAPKALKYAEEALKLVKTEKKLVDSAKFGLLNNVVFSYLEHGKLKEAEALIAGLSPEIHKRSFSTATLGLLHLKKGHFERGEEFYREAISLTKDRELKERIRQKLDLELGKALLQAGELKKAKRHLEKIATNKQATTYYRKMASDLLSQLKRESKK